MTMQTVEINFWDAEGKVSLKEVPVALVEEHNGELIAAVEWDDIYGDGSDEEWCDRYYMAYSVRLGIRASDVGTVAPKDVIDRFVMLWGKWGKSLDEAAQRPMRNGIEQPLPVRGTVAATPAPAPESVAANELEDVETGEAKEE
jgi:hypothetical protein